MFEKSHVTFLFRIPENKFQKNSKNVFNYIYIYASKKMNIMKKLNFSKSEAFIYSRFITCNVKHFKSCFVKNFDD